MVSGTRIFLCSLWQLGQAGAKPLCFTSSTSGVSARSSSCCRDSVDNCWPWLGRGGHQLGGAQYRLYSHDAPCSPITSPPCMDASGNVGFLSPALTFQKAIKTRIPYDLNLISSSTGNAPS